LKPGMKMKEVFDVLGVDVPKRAFISWGGGPADNYGTVYQLAPSSSEHGYNLLVVTDRESKFKSAGIACWLHANKCAEDNEKAKDNPKDCPDNTKKQDQ
jgi:hypothetical protein